MKFCVCFGALMLPWGCLMLNSDEGKGIYITKYSYTLSLALGN